MIKKNSASFRDYFMDDANVSPADRARIEFEVERIGGLLEARESKSLTRRLFAETVGLNRAVGRRAAAFA